MVTDDGDLSAEQVISTIPIHTMVEITEGVPTEVKRRGVPPPDERHHHR